MLLASECIEEEWIGVIYHASIKRGRELEFKRVSENLIQKMLNQ